MPSDPISAAYAVLGVSPSASDDEVRSAYRRLVKLHHPDAHGGDKDAEERLKAINQAFALLKPMRLKIVELIVLAEGGNERG